MPTTKRTKMTVERLAVLLWDEHQHYFWERAGVPKESWKEVEPNQRQHCRHLARTVLKAIAEAKS